MSSLRRSMDPDTLQPLLFLKHNREFWESERTTDFTVKDHTLSDDERVKNWNLKTRVCGRTTVTSYGHTLLLCTIYVVCVRRTTTVV